MVEPSTPAFKPGDKVFCSFIPEIAIDDEDPDVGTIVRAHYGDEEQEWLYDIAQDNAFVHDGIPESHVRPWTPPPSRNYGYRIEAQTLDGWAYLDTLEVFQPLNDVEAIELLLSYKEDTGGPGPYRLLAAPGVPLTRHLTPSPGWLGGIEAGWRFRAIQF